MNKRKEFREKLDRIIKIFCIAKESFNYCRYFYQPSDDKELEFANSNYHIKFIRHILWRQTIIELSKLFSNSKTHKFRISALLNSLERSGYLQILRFPESELLNWEEKIKLNENLINDILSLRDRIYAHTDPNKDEYTTITITFAGIKDLMKIVEDILKKIEEIVFGADLDLSIDSDNLKTPILSSLLIQHNLHLEKTSQKK